MEKGKILSGNTSERGRHGHGTAAAAAAAAVAAAGIDVFNLFRIYGHTFEGTY